MKSANLARRMEPPDEPRESRPGTSEVPLTEAPSPVRPSPRFDRRTIEIRDQGFLPFRVG